MEKDKMQNQLAQIKMWAVSAAIISMLVLLFTIYYGRRIYMKLPKPMSVPTLAMREMTFTEQMQEDMFTRQKMVEVKFEWVPRTSNDTTYLSLTAVGGYMNGETFEWDEGSRVTLDPGNRFHYTDASYYNYNSPLYFSLDDMKMLHKVDAEGSLDPQDISSPILMIPYTSSDPTRRNCVYYGGSTSTESRIANPAPPFSSLSESR